MYTAEQTAARTAAEALRGIEGVAEASDGLDELTLSNAAYLSQWTGNVRVDLPLDGAAFDALLGEHAAHSMTHEEMAGIPEGEYQERWQTRW